MKMLLTRMCQFSLNFMSSLWKRDFSAEKECWFTKILQAWGGGGQTVTQGFILLAQTAPELGRGLSGVSANPLEITAGETTSLVTGTLRTQSFLSWSTVKSDRTSIRECLSDLKVVMKNTKKKEFREAWCLVQSEITSTTNNIRKNSTTLQVREINKV